MSPEGFLGVADVGRLTGVTRKALRLYEEIGLVEPASRTEAGYRLYDEQSLARLSFIARAKQLGCTLEEITELVAAWAGERCAPVQHRLHELVTAKIADVQHRTVELVAFGAQLQAAAAQLGAPPVDGPCDDDCACLAQPVVEPVSVTIGQRSDSVPIACTLEGGLPAMQARIAEWQAVLAHARSRETVAGTTLRLAFDARVPLAELARLVVAEQACCQFFTFAITVDGRGVGLEIGAPEGAEELVASVFGVAA